MDGDERTVAALRASESTGKRAGLGQPRNRSIGYFACVSSFLLLSLFVLGENLDMLVCCVRRRMVIVDLQGVHEACLFHSESRG